MVDTRERTDVTAQLVATEAIAMSLAKVAISGMSEAQKQAFAADIKANANAICEAMAAQAPALARAKGLNPKAAGAAIERIGQYAAALVEAHLIELRVVPPPAQLEAPVHH